MTGLHQYVISTVGGKAIKRSYDPERLLDEARQVLAEGWPVFLKMSRGGDDSIEFRQRGEGDVQIIPNPHANPLWVAQALERFKP